MRRVLKGLCEGAKMGDLTTLEDGASVEEVKKAVEIMSRRQIARFRRAVADSRSRKAAAAPEGAAAATWGSRLVHRQILVQLPLGDLES